MKALVTGGAGFLGARIVTKLLERGVNVTTCSRSEVQHRTTNAEHRTLDLRDAEATAAAIAGHDVVFHVAALAGVWGPRDEYFGINVTGTRNVLAGCHQHGVKTLIYTSTPSVVFKRGGIESGDESLPYPDRFLTHYAETKAIAEREVLAANGLNGLRACALRPHLIWGKGDPHLLPRVLERAKAGKLKQVGDGTNRVDITHISDAAEAHLLALDHIDQAAGKAYFIHSETVQLWPWLNSVLKRAGVAPITAKVSASTAYRAGAVLEFLGKLFGKRSEPLMTRFVAENLATTHCFSIAAAERDFGYSPNWTGEAALDEYFGSTRQSSAPLLEAAVFNGASHG